MSGFAAIEGEGNAPASEQETVELLEARFEGWKPAESSLLTWLNKAWSRVGAGFVDQASGMSSAAFRAFGEKIIGVPPIRATPATVTSVWTMVDDAGYKIPAGKQLTVTATGDTVVGFVTVEDVVVPPEATKATVLVQAVEPGTGGNGLSGVAELSDSLVYVEGVELEGVSSGGVDQEEEDAYLNRLVEELQTLSLSLIIARDFEIDARAVAGIARAKCIEAYNADEGKEEAMAVSVWPIDDAGKGSSTPVKEALEARQRGKLLSGINYYVGVPTYTTVDVLAQVVVQVGFDRLSVLAAVEARLAEYLDPGLWGRPSTGDSGGGWENRDTVYYNEVISEIDRVGGVDRVASLWLGGSGGGKSFTVAAATDVFTTSIAHGYSEGEAVLFREGLTGAAPAAQETLYYVRDLTSTTFKIALAPGGAAVNITADGSGVVVRMKQTDTALNGIVALPTPKTIVVSAV